MAGEQLLHEIFEAVAMRVPARIAIDVPPSESRPGRALITYEQLRHQAGGVAAALSGKAAPDAIVAILLPRENPALYAAQLGVLKSGAAFTCVDPRFPDEHMRAVLEDAGPVAILTDATGRERIASLGVGGDEIIDIASIPPADNAGQRVDPSNLAYVIYTSGTTGKPKGVLIEHRGIVNLVTSDVDYFALGEDERVAQCSSPAYDSSLEETWLAFAAGATLVPIDDATVRLGPDLVPWLKREGITVFCPPPTLLRTMACADPQRDLPGVRLLYVGGEALPADLADAWSAGRWMENGYGPTECTVTVTRGRVRPGEPVTIGRPVRGHTACVLDESMQEALPGQSGELCIAGPGLARGYHHRPDLTAAKFPVHPRFGRIYRTGDLARRNDQGNLEYLGRIDSQVKLRGYRIELSAIEAHLAACEGVRAAACRVQGDSAAQVLAAHIVPARPDRPPDLEMLKQSLLRSLPVYMVPARFAFIDTLPTTIGGKLDRKALPEIEGTDSGRPILAPRDENEQRVAAAFAVALKLAGPVSVEDDFFMDLGGDSLSAVGVVCELRAGSNGAGATVRDLYEARTAAALAKRLRPDHPPAMPPARPAEERPRGNVLACTLQQCLWLGGQLILGSIAAWLLAFELMPFMLRNVGTVNSALLAPVIALAGLLLYVPYSVALTVVVKRLLIGRYGPLRTPVWSSFYARHWIVTSAARLIPWWLVEGTELRCAILRLLGARIGRRVHIHRGVDLSRGGWDLLDIGDEATLSQDAAVRLVELEDGQLVIGPIRIGSGATLDIRAGMSPGSAIGPGAWLTALSWLPTGCHIPSGERWDGVPASPAGSAPAAPSADGSHNLAPTTHALVMLLGRCLSVLVAFLPAVVLAMAAAWGMGDADEQFLRWLDRPRLSWHGAAVIIAWPALSVAAMLALHGLALRCMRRVRPGAYSAWSAAGIRIWVKTGIVDSASRWLSGAILWRWWLRLAGMRLGRGCEISTIIDVVPETIEIGEESFFADGIYLCGPRRCRGTVSIEESRLGRNTFLGNHAVIPMGHRWPDDLFVGVSTAADPALAREGSAWFGQPPMELPPREVVAADRSLTHDPGFIRYATRLIWELLRFALPALPLAVAMAWYWAVAQAGHRLGTAGMLAAVPLATLAAAVATCLAVVVLKWLLLGRVRPGQHAFWSCWCGRWDLLYVAWSLWARRGLALIEGTLLLNAFLRLTGMRIGRRVVLGHGFVQVVDPDMLSFDDDTTVDCHFQAHSFEDRILKIDRIHIGQSATVGDNAVVFYGADIGEAAQASPHSVVMKRDVLRPHTRYAGAPTRVAQVPAHGVELERVEKRE